MTSQIASAVVALLFLSSVAEAGDPPYPSSEWSIEWSPMLTPFPGHNMGPEQARGSDNWPLTWGADGNMYTAYGDGWGFASNNDNDAGFEKLSMGFARIEGLPESFVGTNIRPTNIDQPHADDRSGRKAGGIVMVNDVLYVWTRNANPPGLPEGHGCQLLWSDDPQYKRWNLAFTFREFGYCGFINYGPNYARARNGGSHLYMVSTNHSDAYTSTDDMILTRVPASHNQIIDRDAYEFYSGSNSQESWTADIDLRTSVFHNPGRCFRHRITYNAKIGRYVWLQVIDKGENRFMSGADDGGRFGVYEAPEPWGPWKTMFFTENWDHPAGETAGFPTKWMIDSETMWWVSSAYDAFSVRKATLVRNIPPKPSPPRLINSASSPRPDSPLNRILGFRQCPTTRITQAELAAGAGLLSEFERCYRVTLEIE